MNQAQTPTKPNGHSRSLCLLVVLCGTSLLACNDEHTPAPGAARAQAAHAAQPTVSIAANELLASIVDEFLLQQRNGWRPADQASDHSARAYLDEIEQRRTMLQQLEALPAQQLAATYELDRRLLAGILRSDINTAEARRRWENDASLYLPTRTLDGLLDPLRDVTDQQRLAELAELLGALPEALDHARENLQRPPLFLPRRPFSRRATAWSPCVPG